MNKKFIVNSGIVLLFALLFLSSAMGAPPTNTVITENGFLKVESGAPAIYKLNSNAEIYFHLYNSTGGQVFPENATCYLDLYNKTNGIHLEDDLYLLSHANKDFEYVFNWSKIELGTYTYITTCNKTSIPIERGYLKGEIVVTTTGENISWEDYIFGILVIFLPIIIAFLILYWSLALGEEHSFLKIFTSLLSMILSIFSYAMAILNVQKFFEWTEMMGTLKTQMFVLGILTFVLFTYWCIYLFRMAIKALAEAKMERLKY